MSVKGRIVIISGPTSTGKSDIAVEIAKRLDGEIVSADSMQVYKGMDIGTGKLSEDEMQGVRHHLISVIDPTESYSVSRFRDMALEAIDGILSRGKLPIVVGGTGFYIKSMLYTADGTEPGKDPEYKRQLKSRAEKEGIAALYNELKMKDPDAADRIDRNNTYRIIRALEYNHSTGRRYSEHCDDSVASGPRYDSLMLVMECDRSVLYRRMDERVDRMFENGLIEEVRSLLSRGVDSDCTSMNGIGYKETARYLSGEIPLEEAKRLIKSNTHRYAVRQSTWFRNQKDVVMIDCSDRDRALNEMLERISSFSSCA